MTAILRGEMNKTPQTPNDNVSSFIQIGAKLTKTGTFGRADTSIFALPSRFSLIYNVLRDIELTKITLSHYADYLLSKSGKFVSRYSR